MKYAIHFSSDPPQLIIIVGPCRTGTTALANNFVQAGIKSYMQPIKSMRRAKEQGEKINPWHIETEKLAITKETIGNETPAEFFDPVEILLDLGYPKNKIKLVPMLRDPRQTYASWKRMWGEADIAKLVWAYELILDIKEGAEQKGLNVVPYVHEIIRDNQAKKVIDRLFKEIGLTKTHQKIFRNWSAFKEGGDNLRFYDNPPNKFVDGIKKRGGYDYRDLPFSKSDTQLIRRNPKLDVIYEYFRTSCEVALRLPIKK